MLMFVCFFRLVKNADAPVCVFLFILEFKCTSAVFLMLMIVCFFRLVKNADAPVCVFLFILEFKCT